MCLIFTRIYDQFCYIISYHRILECLVTISTSRRVTNVPSQECPPKLAFAHQLRLFFGSVWCTQLLDLNLAVRNVWTKLVIKSPVCLVVLSLCLQPAEEWKCHCGASRSCCSQVALVGYLHTASIQPCKHVYRSAKSSVCFTFLFAVASIYLLWHVKFHAHVPHEASLVNKSLSKKKIMQFYLQFLWERCNITFRKIPTIDELVRCKISNNWILVLIGSSKGKGAKRPLQSLNFKYDQEPHGLNV